MALFCPATILLALTSDGVSAQVSGERVAAVVVGPGAVGGPVERLAEELDVPHEEVPAVDGAALVELAGRYRGECVLLLASSCEVAAVLGGQPEGEGVIARLEVDEDGVVRLPWPRRDGRSGSE